MADNLHADDYQRGTQEISEQRSTYALFMGMAKWGALAVACAVLFLTVSFMYGGSLVAGFIAAIVVAVVGVFVLKSEPAAH
jgi:hypothetical protein